MYYSFSPLYRLKNRYQFINVLRNGKKRSMCAVASYFIDNNLYHSRLGIVISKRDIKKATRRNLIKRIVRESFRLHKHMLPNMDIIIKVFNVGDNINRKELKECIKKLFLQLI